MRANRITLIVGSAAILAAACSSRQSESTSPELSAEQGAAKTVAGTWGHTAIGPVYRELMTLTQTGDHVSGTGTYAIEAGRQGPTTIDGTLSGKTVTITITRDYGLKESFTGTLNDSSHLT